MLDPGELQHNLSGKLHFRLGRYRKKTSFLMGIISRNSGVIFTVASRWQKVTRKGLETTAGHPAGSQFTPQNVFCLQYGLFKVTIFFLRAS